MLHVIATIEVVPGRRQEFLAKFRELVPKVRAEKGCIEYGPAVDLPTPIAVQAPVRDNVLTVIEKWENVKALEDHLVAPHMSQFRESVKDISIGVTIQIMQPM